MKTILFITIGALVGLVLVGFSQRQQPKKQTKVTKETKDKTAKEVSYKKDIVPIFNKYCLPCHTEDNMNPSELYLESYSDVMKGGKHGIPVVPGKPDSSFLITKIGANPPFGDPMPFKFKRVYPVDTLMILQQWISQGAKNN